MYIYKDNCSEMRNMSKRSVYDIAYLGCKLHDIAYLGSKVCYFTDWNVTFIAISFNIVISCPDDFFSNKPSNERIIYQNTICFVHLQIICGDNGKVQFLLVNLYSGGNVKI